ncbi:MAG: hypothetical protein Q8K55_07705 [Gemmatimonadaceae bacterium]|nr:hypothetical protein [Gemmatimonadaceae bacterium]
MRTALLLRQSVLWPVVRVAHAVVAAIAASTAPPDVTAANAVLQPQPAVVLVCAVLGVVELWRRGERQLIGNLGIDNWQLAAILTAPALSAELVVAIAAGF